MEYRDEDRWLFGVKDEGRVSWWAVVFLILLIIGNLALSGCDLEAAQATHESVMNSQARKEQLPPEGRVNSYLLSQPVGTTWILQAGNDGLGRQIRNPQRRYTQSADFTERK